jgi:hypothetical protein
LDGRVVEASVRRVIVLGGTGLFGRTAAEQLRLLGLTPHIASRRSGADLQIDANDQAAIRRTIYPGDLVLDTAGPFHARTTVLVESAIDIGFDVIDINDNLQYAEAMLALAPRIDRAGIRVLSSASTVSAVAAAIIRQSTLTSPRSVTAFLVPASRHTAYSGAALSLLRSVGRPIGVFCDGRFQEFGGWSQAICFRMPRPLGMIRGGLMESADAAYLPRIWRSLRNVTMYVDANTPGVNALLRLAARHPRLQRMLERYARWAVPFARLLGSSAGGIGYLIEDAFGHVARYAIVSQKNSYLTAVAPAVLAARAVVEDRFEHRGLVPPDRHVGPAELIEFLQTNHINFCELL